MEWIVGAIVIGGFGLLIWRSLSNVPTCICNRPDCGGGCIGKRNK